MPEYIDREAIKAAVRKRLNNSLIIGWLIRIINEIPTAEVALVVHGRWELKHIGAGHYWECSVCHTNPCIYVTKDTNYCPNCGARMDGDSNG